MTFEPLLKLKDYCEKEKFKGWDPYDGLNSKFFQALPFKNWDLARAIWIQIFKLSPLNLRKLLLVPKEYNAKGIALFLLGYCNFYNLEILESNRNIDKKKILSKINFLANLLIEIRNIEYSGACWGYNFDWQARRLFFFPKNTPTVVATAFCVDALFQAYEITKNEKYKKIALSSADFVLNDLNRTPHNSGFLFSYSTIFGNNTVYNASLLGAKILSLCYKYNQNLKFKITAEKAVLSVCEGQENDGSWIYGLLKIQFRKDSFHTGYNLDAISTYQECTGDMQFKNNIKRGFDYYINNFFESNGLPKYYNNKKYPIDIHCPAQLFVTLYKLNEFKNHKDLAKNVYDWSIKNMQSSSGYFYYQLKRGISSKISYMRWSNAFMFNALIFYHKAQQEL